MAQGQRRRRGERPDFNAYLRIGEDGRVTCFTGKVELGQGPITSLAQTLADELDVSLESVDMVMGDTELMSVRCRHVGLDDHTVLRACAQGGRCRSKGGADGPGGGALKGAEGTPRCQRRRRVR